MTPRHAKAARLRERLEQRLERAPSDRVYPVADWQIVERSFAPEHAPALESVFAVANGYLGLRGAPEEGAPAHDAGVILNGFHETWPIVYPEDAYGLARTGQTVANVTDGSIIRLFVDDEPFDLATARIVRFERVLDMQIGVLSREVEFETARGRRLLVRSRRLASLEHRQLAAMDIAYALRQYGAVTGDIEFVLGEAAEVMVETARMWIELGFFSERRDGRFCINSVTGPDEYTTVVNNNAYTNLMAKENLETAVLVVDWLAGQDPEARERLVRATGLTEPEVECWREAAAQMYVPRHEELGIVLQDEHFLARKRWDFEGTPVEKYPLLLHYHPLELYRHQVIKQTDVVLATYLVGHLFNEEETRRTFDYYHPLTTGDSTLSACIQSVIASAVGYPEAALEYFIDACAVDLVDGHGNTADGIHVASCGGTWLALVAGFGGLRDIDGQVRFAPRLPLDWDRLRFRVEVRGQRIEVDMTHEDTTYRLLEGSGLPIEHFGDPVRLAPGEPVTRPATPPVDVSELSSAL